MLQSRAWLHRAKEAHCLPTQMVQEIVKKEHICNRLLRMGSSSIPHCRGDLEAISSQQIGPEDMSLVLRSCDTQEKKSKPDARKPLEVQAARAADSSPAGLCLFSSSGSETAAYRIQRAQPARLSGVPESPRNGLSRGVKRRHPIFHSRQCWPL